MVQLSRNFTRIIHWVLDQLVPPLIRDRRWFVWPAFRLLFGKRADIFFRFKHDALRLSPKEFGNTYTQVLDLNVDRPTDLNSRCITAILGSVVGDRILEIGCGRCYLASLLAKMATLTACDISISPSRVPKDSGIQFTAADVEQLPFPDRSFDTVVCTHTLEHVQNLFLAISELRRVTRRRLVIVVPRQRPYRYTFDLHLHFFPYRHSLLAAMGTRCNNRCQNIGGDLFYVEEADQ